MKHPNIVMILADDMGYGDFSTFNGGLSRTPTLDNLIREGVCLTQQYAASPVCNPSRATLLTGRYPHRTGSVDTLEWHGLERLALRETTLADIFQRSGYRTGLVGKWHLGSYDPRYHPNKRGFDEAICFRGGMHDYYNWFIEYNDKPVLSDGRYLTDVWTDEAVKFIERHQREPFFLHVAYNAPHTPLEAPEDEQKIFKETGQFNAGVSLIYAMLYRMDKGISRILETLKRLGLEENTIVLFTSDNGPQFGGEGNHNTTRFNCHFNGAKGSVYEGGIRVPMIVRWPAGLPGGHQVDKMIHFADWFPTILAAAGILIPEDLKLDGVNVLPILRGEPSDLNPTRFWQWNRYQPVITCNAAVRDGDWKLVRPVIPEAMMVYEPHWLAMSMYSPEYFVENGILRNEYPRQIPDPSEPELYNIANDPLEQEDMAAQFPEITHSLVHKLENWFSEMEKEFREVYPVR